MIFHAVCCGLLDKIHQVGISEYRHTSVTVYKGQLSRRNSSLEAEWCTFRLFPYMIVYLCYIGCMCIRYKH